MNILLNSYKLIEAARILRIRSLKRRVILESAKT